MGPTPGVKGQVVSSPALQASMSISSLAPAARTFGWFASTASAGSFCLFCANGVVGLLSVTNASVEVALTGVVGSANAAAIAERSNREPRLIQGLLSGQLAGPGGIDAAQRYKGVGESV